MPKYFYIAKSFKGEEKSGTLEAKNEKELAKILRQEGYLLIRSESEERELKKRKFGISLPFIGGVSLSEKMIFTRNLKVMIGAGIPLPRALKTLSGLTKSKKFEKAILGIMEEIMKGKSFSDTLAKYPDIFSDIFQSMVKVGEEAGTLEEVLGTLTLQMERQNEMKSKIIGALIYPAVIIMAMLGIGFLMLIMVVPQLAKTFDELGAELPPTTKAIIFIGTFLANYWYLLPLIILVLVILLRRILKTKSGKRIFDALTLKIPIISSLIKKTNSASMVRTLSSLITAGVPIVRSLEIISGAMGNIFYKEAIIDATERVRKGSKLSEVLMKYENIFSSLVVQMIAVGEETGQTSDILGNLADFYEEEVTNSAKNLTSAIEPIIMLIIGGAVGFFAISMIQPMYGMLGSL
jgi:type IV pilus assembly protein PilC